MSAYEKLENHVRHVKSFQDIPISEEGETKGRIIVSIAFYVEAEKGTTFLMYKHAHEALTVCIMIGTVKLSILGSDGAVEESIMSPGTGGTIEIEPGVGHKCEALEALKLITIYVPREPVFEHGKKDIVLRA
jgi:hypothetical protein